jgi:hypothetical protein
VKERFEPFRSSDSVNIIVAGELASPISLTTRSRVEARWCRCAEGKPAMAWIKCN